MLSSSPVCRWDKRGAEPLSCWPRRPVRKDGARRQSQSYCRAGPHPLAVPPRPALPGAGADPGGPGNLRLCASKELWLPIPRRTAKRGEAPLVSSTEPQTAGAFLSLKPPDFPPAWTRAKARVAAGTSAGCPPLRGPASGKLLAPHLLKSLKFRHQPLSLLAHSAASLSAYRETQGSSPHPQQHSLGRGTGWGPASQCTTSARPFLQAPQGPHCSWALLWV